MDVDAILNNNDQHGVCFPISLLRPNNLCAGGSHPPLSLVQSVWSMNPLDTTRSWKRIWESTPEKLTQTSFSDNILKGTEETQGN